MGVEGIQTLITTLGFPIACVIALGFFVWKIWNNSEARNEKREEKLYEVIAKAQLQNDTLSETNAQFVAVLNTYKLDLDNIRNDVAEIKERIK
jgi:predicted negative regulator of RcsB-dependent stress response